MTFSLPSHISSLQSPTSPFSFPLSPFFGILAHSPRDFLSSTSFSPAALYLIFTDRFFPLVNKHIQAAPIIKTQAKHPVIPLSPFLSAKLPERRACIQSFCFLIFPLISLVLNFHLQNTGKKNLKH